MTHSTYVLMIVAALSSAAAAQAEPAVSKVRLTETKGDRKRQVVVALAKGTVTATRTVKNLSYRGETKGVPAKWRDRLRWLTLERDARAVAPAEGKYLELWFTDGSRAAIDLEASEKHAFIWKDLLKLESETIKTTAQREHLERLEQEATARLIKLSVGNLGNEPMSALRAKPNDPQGMGPRLVLELFSSGRREISETPVGVGAQVLTAAGPHLKAAAEAVNAVLGSSQRSARVHLHSLQRLGIRAQRRQIESAEAVALTQAIRAAAKVGIARLRRDLWTGSETLRQGTRVVVLSEKLGLFTVQTAGGTTKVDTGSLDLDIRLDGFVTTGGAGLRDLDAQGAANAIP